MSNYFQPAAQPPADFASMVESDSALPVVVVGAGPVGMGVALGLARRGIAVTILEAADQVSFGSRAICISRHSLEAAERLGFGEELEKIVLPWQGGRSFYREKEVMAFRMPHSELDVRGPMVNVSQSEIEQVMVDTIADEPLITLHWSAGVAGYRQDADGVSLEVHTATGLRHLRAAWVVAADGGRSAMRELSGLRMSGASYDGRYVIADIHWETDLPAERMVWFDAPSNPGSTIIMHRQPRDIWRIDYQLDAADDADFETQEERIRERIARHLTWLGDERPWTLEWHGFYSARALALDNFVHGRVVFAGDAAHLVPIFGVRGLNSGLEDAEALAWQLAAVVNGAAGPELLAAYSAERHDAWQQNIDNAGKSTLIMTPGTHGYRTTRDAVLALAVHRPEFGHLIDPRQSSATHGRRSPLTWECRADAQGILPGEPVEDRRVETTEGESSVHRVRGIGFGIYGFGVDPEALAAAAADLAGRLPGESVRAISVGNSGPVRAGLAGANMAFMPDVDGTVAAGFGARDGEIFIVRPDGLLLCRVDDLAQVAQVPAGFGVAADGAVARPEEDATQTEDAARRERVWLGLSEALDVVDETDREGFLVRLAMLLGSQCTHRELQEAVASAAIAPGAEAETLTELSVDA